MNQNNCPLTHIILLQRCCNGDINQNFHKTEYFQSKTKLNVYTNIIGKICDIKNVWTKISLHASPYLLGLAELVQLVQPLKGRLAENRDYIRAETFWDIWKVRRGSELLLMKDRNFEVFSAWLEGTLIRPVGNRPPCC